MKIVSLNIVAFGKLQNVSVNFRQDLNEICQVNGYGKTTLANFVRAMLYGLRYTASTIDGQRVNDVVRFAPWNSTGKFGGSMVVLYQGKQYKIERFFGQKASQEELKVTQLDIGKTVDLSEGVGEYFLGLTLDSYERSAYFPQEAVQLSSNENLEGRLAQLVENGQEDFVKIQSKLKEYKKQFKYERGSGGLIYQCEQKEFQLSQELHARLQSAQQEKHIRNSLQQIEKQLGELEQERTKQEKQLEQALEQKSKSQLSESDKQLLIRYDAAREKLASFNPSIVGDKAECDQLKAQIQLKESNKKPAKFSPLLLVALVLCLVGVGVCFVDFTIGLIVATVGIAAGVFTLVTGSKNKQVDTTEEDKIFAIGSKYFAVDGLTWQQVASNVDNIFNDYNSSKAFVAEMEQFVKSIKVPSVKDDSVAENIKQRLQQIKSQSTQLIETRASLSAQLEHLNVDSLTVQEQLQRVAQTKTEAKRKYEIAEIVLQLLEQAKENLSSSYLPKLCKRTTELLKYVSASNLQVVVDRNFLVQLCQDGHTKGLSHFSRGIREMTLLCFRIALSELLFGNNIPFLIIDDAFVNYDDSNFARAINLLNSLKTSTQIIYLTCHKRSIGV